MIHNGLAAGIGAGVGIIPALLINRYLLKNKTGSSALTAALIGGGIGAAGGVGLNTYLRGKMIQAQQEQLGQLHDSQRAAEQEYYSLISRLDTADLESEDTRAMVKASLAKMHGVSADQIDDAAVDSVLGAADSSRFLRDATDSGIDVRTLGTNAPLVPLGESAIENLDRIAGKFRARSSRAVDYELTYGAPNLYSSSVYDGKDTPTTQEVFNRIKHSSVGKYAGAGGTGRNRLAAIINYHNKTLQIAKNTQLTSKLPYDMRHELIDYIALSAMPESQRALVPVVHRMTATARARASKGWAYEIDYRSMIDPDGYANMHRLSVAPDIAMNLTTFLTSPFKWGGFLVLGGELGKSGVRHVVRKNMPAWNPASMTRYGNSLGTELSRMEMVRMLSSTDGKIPIYSWQIPEMADAREHLAVTGLLADVTDAGFDIKHLAKGWSNPKSYKFKWPKASKGKKLSRLGLPSLTVSGTLNGLGIFGDLATWQESQALRKPGMGDALQRGMLTDNALVNALTSEAMYRANRRTRARNRSLATQPK